MDMDSLGRSGENMEREHVLRQPNQINISCPIVQSMIMLNASIEGFTDKDLENAIKLHEDLIKFYRQVQKTEDLNFALKTLQDFLKQLHKEKQRRLEYDQENIV